MGNRRQPIVHEDITGKHSNSLFAARGTPRQDNPGRSTPQTVDGVVNRVDFLQKIGSSFAGAAVGMSFSNKPALALFEDARKKGRCPSYTETMSDEVQGFDVDKYMGVWYELGYHDWTQVEFCGCTRFNMTRRGSTIEDMFTTKCPYEYDVADTFAINMTMQYNPATPGRFPEHAFYTTWPNTVVELWKGTNTRGEEVYNRAIQLQCVELANQRAFVGINFLSRVPIVPPNILENMFTRARELGLAKFGANREEMTIVPHEGCQYPYTTDKSVILSKERLSWGSAWGVNILDESLLG
ncbi:unnamed protein product [Discosporangium mesarthrocarpum]